MIAGADAHGKNYALLIGAQARVRLAPLYDVASVLPDPDIDIERVTLSPHDRRRPHPSGHCTTRRRAHGARCHVPGNPTAR